MNKVFGRFYIFICFASQIDEETLRKKEKPLRIMAIVRGNLQDHQRHLT